MRLTVFLQLAALTSAFTTSDPTFGFWDMGTTQPTVFPMYQTVTPAPKPKPETQDQATLEHMVRLAMQNDQTSKNTAGQSSDMNSLLAPWFPGSMNSDTSRNDPVPQVPSNSAQINMVKLQNFMMGNQQKPNGNVGPQQGLGSMYQSFLHQMQKATTTTTTEAPTPSPVISAYTPPPSQYAVSDGRTPSPTKTLAEIILERLNRINETKNNAKPLRSKGCYFKDHWYAPLSEISKGQTGDWCYGTYCNHEGVVVHWDDHKCTQSMPTQPTYTAPTTTPSSVGSNLGCYQNGRWFEPGQDIMNDRNMNTCYGSYCDLNSKVIHWEDQCYATVPPTNMGGGMSGMGGAMGGSAGFSGMESMALAALAGGDGLSGLSGGNGMSGGGMGGMGGMGSMGAMGGMGMGGRAGGVALTDLLKR